jgi:hypothetical protein
LKSRLFSLTRLEITPTASTREMTVFCVTALAISSTGGD